MSKTKLLIALAATFATGATVAATSDWVNGTFTIVKDDADIAEVATKSDATDAKGFVQVQSDVTSAHIGKLTLNRAGAADNGKYYGAYLKNYGETVNIDTLHVTGGTGNTTETVALATLEFWPQVVGGKYQNDERAKAFNVGTVNLDNHSVLRVTETSFFNTSDFSNSAAGKVKGPTSFTAREINMTGDAALALDVGSPLSSLGAATIGVINAKGAEGSTMGTGIAAGSNSPSVAVGTINIEDTKFDLTGEVLGSIKAGSSTLSGKPVTLVALGADEAAAMGQTAGVVTVNMLDAASQIAFGGVGEPASAAKLASNDATDTSTTLRINFSKEALGSDTSSVTFSEPVADGTSIAAVALEGGADDSLTTAAVAQDVLDKVYTAENQEKLGDKVEKTVEVAAFDVNDGAVYEVVKSDDPEGGLELGNVIATKENAVTHGLTELAVVGVMQWREEMNHMQYRLGEIRDQKGYANGGWARVYGGKDEYGSQNVDNEYVGVQAGYDHRLEGTNWVVGGALSFTKGDSSFDAGEGDNHTLAFTGYGTWLADNGMFIDVTGKYGTLSNDVTVAAGTASYDTNAVAVTVEGGWRFPLASIAYVEPQAEMMYGHIWGADYDLGAMSVSQDSVDLMVGRLGVQTGIVCPDNRGSLYLRASVLHDFEGETEYTYKQANTATHTEDLGGTWWEVGLGGNLNVTDSTMLYADVQYADGDEIESPWRASVGVRLAW